MRNLLFKALWLLILLGANSYSQKLVPPIQNYLPKDYSAASQNWDIALDKKGIVYCANNQGLLVYDGLTWELFPLESQAIIRSVFPYKDRIYTGSYKEFGYWKRNEKGELIYTSLRTLLNEFDLQSDEFWEITAFENNIYFRSFGAIYKYGNNKIEKVKDVVSTALEIYRGKLVIAQRNEGLVFIDEMGNPTSLEGDFSKIKNQKVVDLAAFGDSLFIGSRNGVYIYSDGNLSRFPDPVLNTLLTKYELNHITAISNDELILGTVKNGIIDYSLKSGKLKIFNRSLGLQNNTILGMIYFNDKLWLALDKGIDAIDLNAPINFYTDKTGELGAVYDMVIYNGNYYIASNTGVYRFKNNELKQIDRAEGHTWNLEVIDDILYANHNTGTYRILNDQFIPVESRTGSFSLKKWNGTGDRLLICNYTGLSIYDPASGELKEIDSVNFPIKKAIFEEDYSIWAAHPYEGIYHLVPDNSYNITAIEKVPPITQKANYNPQIYKINNSIIAYLKSNWFKYNPFKEEFENFEEFKDFRNCRLIHNEPGNFIFIDEKEGSVIFTDLKNSKVIIPAEKFNYRLVKSNENFISTSDSIFYATLNDGFAQINLNKLQATNKREWLSTPFIKQFSDAEKTYPLKTSSLIPFKSSRNINFKVGMPLSESKEFHYDLAGADSLNGTVKNGIINFRNLTHGSYKLELTAKGTGSREIRGEVFNFSIAPPWYLSFWMKSIYVFLFLLIILFIYWLNKKKLGKHQLQLEEKFEKEHSDRVNRLEKERLMREIDIKRKELANTTMMAAKKNEVLMEIQGELSKDKNKFSNQFRLKHIMNKINSAVKNKDEWKVFETNFNEVHEDFFKDVLKQYPKLTSKDLKLCSYLKMNLSSKEIAPLMGISVRGVEVHRYRLRKKMNLDGDVNLTKFLIKNF